MAMPSPLPKFEPTEAQLKTIQVYKDVAQNLQDLGYKSARFVPFAIWDDKQTVGYITLE